MLSLLAGLREPVLKAVIEPLVTVGLLLGLYTGWHIRDEGNLAEGLRVAFVDTRANREAEQQAIVGALMQAELHQYAKASKLIDEVLTVLIQHSAGAARIRLGVVHNGVSGLTGTAMLRYDVVNAVALPGLYRGRVCGERAPVDLERLSSRSVGRKVLADGRSLTPTTSTYVAGFRHWAPIACSHAR